MELSFVPQPERRHTEMGLAVVPEGLERLLVWLHERYGQPPMYITENGAAFIDEPDEHEFVQDHERIAYVRAHLRAARAAMNAGVDLRGYFVWSLLDNFEWADGYEKRFGIVRCDNATLKRTIKASGKWYADVIRTGVVADNSSIPEQAA